MPMDDHSIGGLHHITCGATTLSWIQALAADCIAADLLEPSLCQRSTSTTRCTKTTRTNHHRPCRIPHNQRNHSTFHILSMCRIPLRTARDMHLHVDRQQVEAEAEAEGSMWTVYFLLS